MRQRLHLCPAGIDTLLKTVEDEIKSVRQAISDLIGNDPDLDRRRGLLESIPGIGEATVAHLLIALSPHQGFTHAKQVVAFAGLAPALRESGQWTGKARISKKRRPRFAQGAVYARLGGLAT